MCSSLEWYICKLNISLSMQQSTLKAFLSSLEDTDIYTYTHMHALTAFVEILSTYLVIISYLIGRNECLLR